MSDCLSLRLFICVACRNTSTIPWPFQACGSSSFQKLLKVCNSLFYLFPFVLVIPVNHVPSALISLVLLSRSYSEMLLNVNRLRRNAQNTSVIGKEKQNDVRFLFYLPALVPSHLSGQGKIGSIIEKGIIWDFLKFHLQTGFSAIEELRWKTFCSVSGMQINAHQLTN